MGRDGREEVMAAATGGSATKRKRKAPHSAYCEYAYNCDKDIDCKNGDFCAAFKHTTRFSSLRFGGKNDDKM